MKKRIVAIGSSIGAFMAVAIVAYAITNLFFTSDYTTDLSKKQIFQFDLNTGASNGEVGPGDSFDISPVIFNDATEEMYVFVKIQMPEWNESPLYTFEVDDNWSLIESNEGSFIYAYGCPYMTVLNPGESTSALTNQMTMCSISNADYSAIDDINVSIMGYAIGTEDVDPSPSEAWSVCKQLGNLE